MEHTSFRFIYHDELTHYDKEAWLEVGDFAGWAVVECNCKLQTKYNYNLRVEGLVSYLAHNQEKSDSVSEPATNENRISDVRIAEVKHALEVQMVGDETVSKEQPANRAGLVGSSGSMPNARNEESAASSTEPSEVN